MNDDVRFNLGDSVFNYRVASIVRKNNKILVQKNDECEYLSLIGGRCKICEKSKDAILREFKEETGIDANIKKEIAVLENFFMSDMNDKQYHEILMVFELEFKDSKYYEYEELESIEDNKDHIKYIWVPLEELRSVDFRPRIVLDLLDKDSFQHIYN